MNVDIENHIKFSTCLEFQQKQTKEKLIHHEIPGQSWEVAGLGMFTLYDRNYLYILDYHSIAVVYCTYINKHTQLSVNGMTNKCHVTLYIADIHTKQ